MESYQQQEEEAPSDDDEQHEYVFELNEHDVLCGRGSGPNDRQGNIAFRNLVLTRKAEYLAAPSRDAKGRIANEIVATIRSRGGRFLKKISPTQAKERGFNRNKAVYELADEDTVLEKAKQTLRQNRADFVKEHGLPTDGVGGQGRTMRGTTTVNQNNNNNNTDWGLGGGNLPNLHQLPHTLNNLPCKLNNLPNTLNNLPTTLSNFPQNIMHGASSAQNLMNNNVGGGETSTSSSNINMNGSNLNPIPLDASSGLDSMQRPQMSANTAAQLNNALFSMSSVTNPSFNSNPQMGCSNSNTQMGINMNMGNTNQMGSSSDYSTLSMNTADLYNAMGMSVNTTTNNSNTSTTSTQAFESLVKEYAIQEEKALTEQFLQQQQQGGGQQQQALPQDMQGQNYIYQQQQHPQQPNMNNDGKQQQYLADDQLSSLQGLQNQQQTYNNQPEHQHDNVFASLVQTFAGGDQIQPSEQHQQQQTTLNNNADHSLSDLDAQQQFLLQQFQQIQRMQAQRQTEARQGQQQQQQTQHQDMSVPLNDTQVPLNDAQQFPMGTYTDTSVPLNYQPAKKQPSTNNTNYDKKDSAGSHLDGSSKSNEEAMSADTFTFKYDPTRRRSSQRRRSTLRRNNASDTTQATNASGTSLGLSNLEPSSLEDESLTMSYKTAQRLARTFNNSSMTMGTSHMTRNSVMTNDLDASMLSLMSLSLGGSARSLIDPSLNKHDNIDEKLLASLKEEGRASSRQPSEVTVEAKKNNDLGESVMSLEPWSPKES